MMLMSVVVSPRLHALDITMGGRLLTVVRSTLTSYAMYVEPGYAALLDWPEAFRAASALASLMKRVAELARSSYYTYTGPLDEAQGPLVFKPFVSTSAQVEVVIRGGVAEVPQVRRRFRTGLDVEAIVRRGVTIVRYGAAGLGTAGVKVVRQGVRI